MVICVENVIKVPCYYCWLRWYRWKMVPEVTLLCEICRTVDIPYCEEVAMAVGDEDV